MYDYKNYIFYVGCVHFQGLAKTNIFFLYVSHQKLLHLLGKLYLLSDILDIACLITHFLLQKTVSIGR